jgi:4-amino-4-deoxy-L-arabinose transferase-like glycosyltransferase
MLLHQLGLAHARDYDEGVYWESLRAMHAGHVLYRDIYSSQPPLFLAAAHPMFEAFGGGLFAARFSCVAFSLAGLLGAYLTGRALAGPWGAAAAMLLAATSVAYVQMSQTLQAEASAVALSWCAVGMVLAARSLSGARRTMVAALAGAAIAAALLCKLLVIATIAPVLLGVAMPVAAASRRPRALAFAVLGCSLGFGVALALGVLPYIEDGSAAWRQVVLLHAGVANGAPASFGANAALLARNLVGPLPFAALFGATIAVQNGDRRVVVLLGAWCLLTLVELALLAPLFPHHLVALVPPLVSLAALGVAPGAQYGRIGAGLVGICAVLGVVGCVTYFVRDARLESAPETLAMRAAVLGVDRLTVAGSRIVTDDQFAAALADRDTPPWLVDTSFARIHSGQLTRTEVLAGAGEPTVDGILLFSNRLAALMGLRASLAERYALRIDFGGGRELWTRRGASRGPRSRVFRSSASRR